MKKVILIVSLLMIFSTFSFANNGADEKLVIDSTKYNLNQDGYIESRLKDDVYAKSINYLIDIGEIYINKEYEIVIRLSLHVLKVLDTIALH